MTEYRLEARTRRKEEEARGLTTAPRRKNAEPEQAAFEAENEKAQKRVLLGFGHSLGWLMGLEPTTTGITILDSTN